MSGNPVFIMGTNIAVIEIENTDSVRYRGYFKKWKLENGHSYEKIAGMIGSKYKKNYIESVFNGRVTASQKFIKTMAKLMGMRYGS